MIFATAERLGASRTALVPSATPRTTPRARISSPYVAAQAVRRDRASRAIVPSGPALRRRPVTVVSRGPRGPSSSVPSHSNSRTELEPTSTMATGRALSSLVADQPQGAAQDALGDERVARQHPNGD